MDIRSLKIEQKIVERDQKCRQVLIIAICFLFLITDLCNLFWSCTAIHGLTWHFIVFCGLCIVTNGLLMFFIAKHRFYWTCIVFSNGHRSKFIWYYLLWSELNSKKMCAENISKGNQPFFIGIISSISKVNPEVYMCV